MAGSIPEWEAGVRKNFVTSRFAGARGVPNPRAASSTVAPIDPSARSQARSSIPIAVIGLVVLLGATGAGLYIFRDKIFKKPPSQQARGSTNAPAKKKAPPAPKVTYAVPTNITWSLELTNADLPETTAAGSIHSSGFLCERSVLQGVAARDAKPPPRWALTLRQGKSGSPDLGLTLQLF